MPWFLNNYPAQKRLFWFTTLPKYIRLSFFSLRHMLFNFPNTQLNVGDNYDNLLKALVAFTSPIWMLFPAMIHLGLTVLYVPF